MTLYGILYQRVQRENCAFSIVVTRSTFKILITTHRCLENL